MLTNSWGSVSGPVIQANGRLMFEDDLTSEGQRPHCTCRQYGHPGGTRGWLGVEKCQLCLLRRVVPRQTLSRESKEIFKMLQKHRHTNKLTEKKSQKRVCSYIYET